MTSPSSEPKVEDRSLAARFKGDLTSSPEAWTTFFKTYYRPAIQFVFSRYRASIRSERDAEDIVEDAFLEMYEGVSRGEVYRHPWTCLIGMVRAKAIDAIRHSRVVDPKRRPLEGGGVQDNRDPRARRPVSELESMELHAAFEMALERLSEDDRLIYNLRSEGHGPQEIGSKIGKTQGQVEDALKAIRRKLLEFLGQIDSYFLEHGPRYRKTESLTSKAVSNAFDLLRPEYARVLSAHYEEGKSLGMIAREFDIASEEEVRRPLERGRELLLRYFKLTLQDFETLFRKKGQ